MAPENQRLSSYACFLVTLHKSSSILLEDMKQRVGLPHSKEDLSILFAWCGVALKKACTLFNLSEYRLCCRPWPAAVSGRLINRESAICSVWENCTGKEHL